MNAPLPDVVGAEVARLLAALPTIRPVRSGDRARIEALMQDLSPLARFRRFHGTMRELPPALLDRLARVAAPGEAALLATTVVRGREIAVGEARYAMSAERHDASEIAIAVVESWQRLGVGTELIGELIRHAVRSGVRALYGDTFADNTPMLALAHKLGFESGRHPVDARLVRVSLKLHRSIDRPVSAAVPRAAGPLAPLLGGTRTT